MNKILTPLYLYIHIPFCLQKCGYCTFATVKNNDSDHSNYVSYVIKEMEMKSKQLESYEVQTIYFGGGTPSLLKSKEIQRMIHAVYKLFNVTSYPEVTVEVNPGTMNEKKISSYLDVGINRWSLGVQTFKDTLLKKCGREHGSVNSREDLKAFSKNKLNFSCDLLFALPNQNIKNVAEDLEEMLSYRPAHISTYCLTLPQAHPLQKNRVCDEKQVLMFKTIEEMLSKQNYIQYEISNFARDNHLSKHNQAYWDDKNFLGFGLSAHSYWKSVGDFGVRFWNSRNKKEYQAQISSLSSLKQEPYLFVPPQQRELLTRSQAFLDFCHTALRTNKGLKKNSLEQKFDSKALDEASKRLNIFKKEGWVQESREGWSLSFDGRMWSNKVFEAFL